MNYIKSAMQYPVLDQQEEQKLAKLWLEHGDQSACNRLVTSHLRLVIKIASRYKNYGLPLEDLIAEGNLGLINAINRFEPERGFRLSTYAMWWIRASIQEYLMRSWSLVKIGTTKNQKKLFFKLRATKARLQLYEDGQLDRKRVETIATELHVAPEEVVSMNQRLSKDSSLNTPLDMQSETMEWQDTLVSDMDDPEKILVVQDQRDHKINRIKEAMSFLNKRERKILQERYLSDERITLRELGEHFGISHERVRQIEARAFKKIKQSLGSAEPLTV